jgi:hypothetical protein
MTSQKCPNCGHNNSKQATHCQKCKVTLKTTMTQADMDAERDEQLDQTGVIDLVPLNQGTKSDDTIATRPPHDAIDSALVTSTVNIEYDDDDGESQFGGLMIAGDLLLTDVESKTVFSIARDRLDEVIIGRKNRQNNFVPTVDLTALDGHTKGVSRRHATLLRKGNWLMIVDHDSKNGSALNGQLLVPEQPRIIREGDTIRIGLINLIVSYQKK